MKDERDDRGIRCPQCGCRHFYTTNTEPLHDGRIRRRKVCRHCGRKLVTHESPLNAPPKGLNSHLRATKGGRSL